MIDKVNLRPYNKIYFKGIRTPKSPCLFVLDLGGTFAEGSSKDIESVCKIAKSKNASLIYTTGKDINNFQNLQKQCKLLGFEFPLPDFLIAKNGLFIYKKNNGVLVEDKKWKEKVSKNFDRKKILEQAREIALSHDFSMNGKKPNNFSDSKLCEFDLEENDSMIRLICSDSSAITAEKRLNEKFKRAGMNLRIIRQVFHKDELEQVLTPEQLEVCSARYEVDKPFCHIIDILSADRCDAVNYLKKILDIPNSEIIIAGNDKKDISLLPLTLFDAMFICPANSTRDLINLCNILMSQNIYKSDKIGAKGVLEGIKHFIADA